VLGEDDSMKILTLVNIIQW